MDDDFFIGAKGFDNDMFCIIFSGLAWPLFWVVYAIMNTVDWIELVMSRDDSNRPKRVLLALYHAMKLIILPLRPFYLGCRLAETLKTRGKL